jgi:hypothetical protein
MPPHHPTPTPTGAAVVAGAVLLLTVGCHPPDGRFDQPPHAPAVHEQAGGTLPARAAAATLGPTSDPPRAEAVEGVEDAAADAGADEGAGGDGPEQAAARWIVDTLAAQGLHTVVLDTHLADTGPDRASVRVQVAHHPGSGHPTQADYHLELTRTPTGWQPAPTERSG